MQHRSHARAQGSVPEVGHVSEFRGRYTQEFVEAVLRTVPKFREHVAEHEVFVVEEELVPSRCCG